MPSLFGKLFGEKEGDVSVEFTRYIQDYLRLPMKDRLLLVSEYYRRCLAHNATIGDM